MAEAPGTRQNVIRAILVLSVALAYFLTGKLGTLLSIPPGVATAVWPPSGIALAAVIMWGPAMWPGVMLGSLLVNVPTLWSPGFGGGASAIVTGVGIAAGSALQALFGGWLIRRFIGARYPLERVGEVVKFTAFAIFGCLIASSTGSASLWLAGYIEAATLTWTFSTWWIGDTVGVLVVTPVVLLLARASLRERVKMAGLAERAIFLASLVAVGNILFGSFFGGLGSRFLLPYMIFPFGIWAAFRLGQRMTVLATLLAAILCLLGTIHGRGPFATVGYHSSLMLVQSFVALYALTSLVLAAAIHERNEAEDEIRAGREQLSLVIDALPALITYVDRDERYVFNNRAYEEWFGYRRDELRGRTMAEVMGDAGYASVKPHVRAALAGKGSVFEARVPYRAGGLRWIEASYVPHVVRDAVEGFVALVTDISDRKRGDASQKFLADATAVLATDLDSEKTLVKLVHLAVPAMADWSAVHVRDEGSGEIRRLAVAYANPEKTKGLEEWSNAEATHAIEKVIGAGRAELVKETQGSTLRSLGMQSALLVPLAVRGTTVGVLTLVFAESGRQYEEVDLLLVEEIARRAAIAVDNAKLYRDAQQAIGARDKFMSIASHELRTPLTSQQLHLESIFRTLGKGDLSALTPERMMSSLENVKRQGDRLSHLINNLLDVSRITAGRLTLALEKVDLAEVTKSVVDRMREEIRRSGSDVSVEVAPAVGRWDPLRLEQIVTNLLTNSLKYGQGRPVRIAVAAGAEKANLVVRDRGIGISADDQERLFKPFERAVSTTRIGGMGLGLYIVRQIVESHGGTVAVESAPGQGSTFTIELPYVPPE